jgi:hypothetical protein
LAEKTDIHKKKINLILTDHKGGLNVTFSRIKSSLEKKMGLVPINPNRNIFAFGLG